MNAPRNRKGVFHFGPTIGIDLLQLVDEDIYSFSPLQSPANGDQFKSGGGEGGLFYEDLGFKFGATMTFAEFP